MKSDKVRKNTLMSFTPKMHIISKALGEESKQSLTSKIPLKITQTPL